MIDLVEENVIERKIDLRDLEHMDPVQLSVYGHRLMGIAEQVSKISGRKLTPIRWGIY